ncbi:MAG: hypothetical protein ABL921_26595, partial [Pirellula sp.]
MKVQTHIALALLGLVLAFAIPPYTGWTQSRIITTTDIVENQAALNTVIQGDAQETIKGSVTDWIRKSAVPINLPQKNFGDLDRQFSNARVVALGEATHGQHEVFDLKRQITMHLIQNHGYRMVSYEASVSSLMNANAYIAGTSDDRQAAIGGLGML